MSPAGAKKTFDRLAYKEKVQREIYEEIKGLTPQQQFDYFNRAAESGPLAECWQRIRRATSGLSRTGC